MQMISKYFLVQKNSLMYKKTFELKPLIPKDQSISTFTFELKALSFTYLFEV